MFRRRRRTTGEPEPDGLPDDLPDDGPAGDGPDYPEVVAVGGDPAPGGAPGDDADDPLTPRPDGPWDSAEVDQSAEERVDLGSLRVGGVDGMELRIDVDEATGTVAGVTAVLGQGAVQLAPFAAPRSSGIWAEVRGQIRADLAGADVEERDGPFGPELRATVTGVLPDGAPQRQEVRFVGVNGPRWFLRAVFMGAAAAGGDAARPLEDVLRDVVVVRGPEPRAPAEALPLSVPGAPAPADAPGAPPGLGPFERGPEVTEIR